MRKLILKLANNKDPNSLVSKFRRNRASTFMSLLKIIEFPKKILDVGGVPRYWELLDIKDKEKIEFTILNLDKYDSELKYIKCIIGDARNMDMVEKNEYDVVYSNSVIEHVGDYQDQKRMADEVMRVGKRYCIQTPNRFFPIEPHFLFPVFQFLPAFLKIWLVMNFNIGNYDKISDKETAVKAINGIRLMTYRELNKIFPGATIIREKFFGLTKSFIIFKGWNVTIEGKHFN